MTQPIGSRLHGIIDYAVGGSLIAASRLPPLRGRFAGRALLGAGANHLLYSAVTDYEVGLVRKLPYRAHLAVDAVAACGLLAAGLLQNDALDRAVPLGVALQELTVVALSDPGGAGA
jgi:hypothetical protein